MFVTTSSGFTDTPVTKLWCYFSLGVPLLISLAELQYLFEIQIQPQLTQWHQWWRLALNQLIYTNQSEVLLSVLFIYNMRILERLLGSHKYLSLLGLCYFLASLLTPSISFIMSLMLPKSFAYKFNTIASSQTVVISALLYLYHELVPVVYRFELSPVGANPKAQFSDKIFIYFVVFQLVTFHFAPFLLQFFIGWTVSSLLHNELIPGKSWRLPLYKYLHLEDERRASYSSNNEQQPSADATGMARSDTIDGGNDIPTDAGANTSNGPSGVAQVLSIFRQ